MTLGSPVKFLFPGQQPGERIYIITRKHWIVLARDIAFWLIFAGILFFYDAVIVSQFPELTSPQNIKIANFVKSIYLMYLVAGFMTVWLLYYLNYQIITNERLVDVDQKNLLYHSTTEIHLEQIEDVSSEIKGLLGNLFNYGHVYVQTAGTKTRFEFDYVPDPNAVVKQILDLYQQIPAARRGQKGLTK